MPNVSQVSGFTYHSGLSSNSYPALRKAVFLAADATATFIGDAVTLSGSADADGVPSIKQYAVGDPIYGHVVFFEIEPSDLTLKHRKASTLRYAQILVADGSILEIQEDGVGGALAAADVGLNADLIVGAGNATTGFSGMQLDTSTKATTGTLAVRILGLVQRPDNAFGEFAKVLVKINESQLGHTTAGV